MAYSADSQPTPSLFRPSTDRLGHDVVVRRPENLSSPMGVSPRRSVQATPPERFAPLAEIPASSAEPRPDQIDWSRHRARLARARSNCRATAVVLSRNLAISMVTLVALGARESAHVQPFEDPPHAGGGDLDVVIALEVHRDLVRPEVIVLAQIDDLAEDLGPRGVRARVRPARRVPEALDPVLLVAAQPLVVRRAADAVSSGTSWPRFPLTSWQYRIIARRLATLRACSRSVIGSPLSRRTRCVHDVRQF
jgi:hypothetical protein